MEQLKEYFFSLNKDPKSLFATAVIISRYSWIKYWQWETWLWNKYASV